MKGELMVDDFGDDFDDDDGECTLAVPFPEMGAQVNAWIDQYLADTAPVPESRSQERRFAIQREQPEPTSAPPVQVTPESMAAFTAHCQRLAAEDQAKARAALVCEYCAVHGINGLGRLLRFAAGPTLEERAEAWAAAGKPAPNAKPKPEKSSGLASLIRLQKGTQISLSSK